VTAVVREIVNFDQFSERECPYFRPNWNVNNGFGCAHPEQEDTDDMELANGRIVERGRCYFFSCPLGASISPHTEPLDAEMLRRAGKNPDDYGDGELFVLARRPKHRRPTPGTGGGEG
jgi:hypothetical protein